jgi:hypothetical protein
MPVRNLNALGIAQEIERDLALKRVERRFRHGGGRVLPVNMPGLLRRAALRWLAAARRRAAHDASGIALQAINPWIAHEGERS